MTICFLDTETTGLNSDRHDIWEIAAIVTEHPTFRDHDLNGEWVWQIWPDLANADPTGLRVSRFYQRQQLDKYSDPGCEERTAALLMAAPPSMAHLLTELPASVEPWQVAGLLTKILDGATVVGAVPDFDARFLTRFLNRHGHAATWHYHLQDVETLVAGFLRGRGETVTYPYRSDELSVRIGVEPSGPDERHTALGDARWVRRQWDAVWSVPTLHISDTVDVDG